jgi:hypothetical protein
MKLRFIKDVLSSKFTLEGSRDSWLSRLAQMKYLRYGELTQIQSTKIGFDEPEDSDRKDYDYILNLPIWTFTKEKVRELEDLEDRLKVQLQNQEDTMPIGMWLDDINSFEDAWN